MRTRQAPAPTPPTRTRARRPVARATLPSVSGVALVQRRAGNRAAVAAVEIARRSDPDPLRGAGPGTDATSSAGPSMETGGGAGEGPDQATRGTTPPAETPGSEAPAKQTGPATQSGAKGETGGPGSEVPSAKLADPKVAGAPVQRPGAGAKPAKAGPTGGTGPSSDGGGAGLAAFKRGAGSVGTRLRKKPPAASHVSQMQGAAKGPANEKVAGGKAAQVDDMDAAPPGTFDKASFIAAVEKAVAANSPKNLGEAEDLSGSGKMGKVKDAVNAKVGDGKSQAAEKVEGATEKPPDPSRGEQKPVQEMPPPDKTPQPGSVGAAKAMPNPQPAAATDLTAPKQEVDQQMAAEGLTEEQLAQSEEPTFLSALAAKKAGDKHTKQAPGPVKAEEANLLGQARTEAAAAEKTGLSGMTSARNNAEGAIGKSKSASKGRDESARKKVSDRIEQIYSETQADSTKILSGLDKKVDDLFTKGEGAARAAFEAKHKKDFGKWKDDRYGGVLGKGRWLKDEVLGVPPEANAIFDRARAIYLTEMKKVIASIADVVASELNAAKARIAQGRTEIAEYVASLPQDLKSVGSELAGDVQAKFDALDADVDSKQDELVKKVAGKYNEAKGKVDAKIKQLKEANSGLWGKAKAAIAGVAETVRQLKNAIMTALKGAADAISLIITNPKRFLTNLISAVKNGLTGFVKNIGGHLKQGFFGWLTGAVAEAGIQMPQSFDLKGIIGLILQIMGATWASIRAMILKRLKSKFGPKAEAVIGKIEAGVAIIGAVMSEGPIALWKIISQQVTNLWDMVVGKLKEFLITKVITAGVTWIIGILNPAAGFIKICKAIVDIVMWFWNNASRISELVTTIAGSAKAIAQGSIGAASKAVEGVLVKMLPLAIGFLASLLGLGGISKKIRSVMKTVQRPITKVINKVVDKAVGLGKKFVRRPLGGDKVSDKKKTQLDAGLVEGAAAIDHMAVGELQRGHIAPVLDKIKNKYGLRSLTAFARGGKWWVRGKLNPEGESPTSQPARLANVEDIQKIKLTHQQLKESIVAWQIKNRFTEDSTRIWIENLDDDIRSMNARQKKVQEGGVVTELQISGYKHNAVGIRSEFEKAKVVDGFVEAGANKLGRDIDIVAEFGRRWIEVKGVSPYGIESSNWRELERQIENILRVKDEIDPGITVEVHFSKGCSTAVWDSLTSLGVQVSGKKLNPHE